jgi:hypothetical protein
MSPGSERNVKVAVMLSKDAKGNMRGLAENDVATISARGGFTDHAAGTISITTAGRDKDMGGERRGDDMRIKDDADRKLDMTSTAAPGDSPDNPTPGTPSMPSPVTLPAECEQAGMRLDTFEDVIVLDPGQRTWSALEQRGKGAGPFLIVGSDGDDDIVGSESADCIVGADGHGRLAGGAGDDVLIGGAEADLLDGGPGNDWLLGGPGVDDLRGGGGIDRFDGGPDGASCDAGRDATGATRCQAPTTPGSSTSDSGGSDRSVEPSTSPTTASPPAPESSPTTTSPSATTAVAPASARSEPSATPIAQAEPFSYGAAAPSAPSGAREGPSADVAEDSVPPNCPTGA